MTRHVPTFFRHVLNLPFGGGFFPAMASATFGTIRNFRTRRFDSDAVNG
jgi:hypothetical protein